MFGAIKARFGIRTAIVRFAQLDEEATKSVDKNLEVVAVEKGSPGDDATPQLQAKIRLHNASTRQSSRKSPCSMKVR